MFKMDIRTWELIQYNVCLRSGRSHTDNIILLEINSLH